MSYFPLLRKYFIILKFEKKNRGRKESNCCSCTAPFYLIPLHLQPEEHVILQEVSLQGDKVLELHTSDRIKQDLTKQENLFGGIHPQAVSLQGATTEMRYCELLIKPYSETLLFASDEIMIIKIIVTIMYENLFL